MVIQSASKATAAIVTGDEYSWSHERLGWIMEFQYQKTLEIITSDDSQRTLLLDQVSLQLSHNPQAI